MRAVASIVAMLSWSCATNMALLERANTNKQGQARAAGQVGFHIPVASMTRAYVAGRELSEAVVASPTGENIPDGTLRDALAAGTGLALVPPGIMLGGAARVGLTDIWDLGARISTSAWRLDSRVQLLEAKNGRALTLWGGYEQHRFNGLLSDVYDQAQNASMAIPFLYLEDPKRWDGELVLQTGMAREPYFKTYSAVRYRVAVYDFPSALSIEVRDTPLVTAQDLEGVMHMPALTGGMAFGYKRFWFQVELTGSWNFAQATIMGQPVELGGPVLFPAFGMSIDTPPKWTNLDRYRKKGKGKGKGKGK